MEQYLPVWARDWIGTGALIGEIVLIIIGAWLVRAIGRGLIQRVCHRYAWMPPQLVLGGRRVLGFLVAAGAVLLILGRLGVSGTVLWTAFTGFAAVGAVAFFAAWSVLSNIFCTVLILTARPFRLGDWVEVLENGEKAGLMGRVVDVNLVYTTLRESDGDEPLSLLRVPNNLFFQRTVRRYSALDGGRRPERLRPPAAAPQPGAPDPVATPQPEPAGR